MAGRYDIRAARHFNGVKRRAQIAVSERVAFNRAGQLRGSYLLSTATYETRVA